MATTITKATLTQFLQKQFDRVEIKINEFNSDTDLGEVQHALDDLLRVKLKIEKYIDTKKPPANAKPAPVDKGTTAADKGATVTAADKGATVVDKKPTPQPENQFKKAFAETFNKIEKLEAKCRDYLNSEEDFGDGSVRKNLMDAFGTPVKAVASPMQANSPGNSPSQAATAAMALGEMARVSVARDPGSDKKLVLCTSRNGWKEVIVLENVYGKWTGKFEIDARIEYKVARIGANGIKDWEAGINRMLDPGEVVDITNVLFNSEAALK